VSNAAAGAERDVIIDMKEQHPAIISRVKIPPPSVPLDKKIAAVKLANKAARSMDCRIKQARIVYSESLQKIKFAASDGIIAKDERTYTMGMAQVISSDGASL